VTNRGDLPIAVTVYRFTTTFPSFTAVTGMPYWLSPRSNGPTFLPVFS